MYFLQHKNWAEKKVLVNETKFQEFFVESNNNYVIIKPTEHPKNYISYLTVDKSLTSGGFKNRPIASFEALLHRYQINPKTFFGLFNKELRYKEGIIEIGEQITVAGIVKWKSLSELIAEYPYSKIATLEASEQQKLIITDLTEALVWRKGSI